MSLAGAGRGVRGQRTVVQTEDAVKARRSGRKGKCAISLAAIRRVGGMPTGLANRAATKRKNKGGGSRSPIAFLKTPMLIHGCLGPTSRGVPPRSNDWSHGGHSGRDLPGTW